MTAVNRNSYTFPEIDKKDLTISDSLIDRVCTYPGPGGYTKLPGMFNLITLPKDIYRASQALRRAYKINDEEGSEDALIRLLGAPATFIHSTLSTFNLGLQIGTLFNVFGNWKFPKEFMKAAAYPIAITGLILCTYEAIFEVINTKRQGSFLNQLSTRIREELEQIFAEKDPVRQGEKILVILEKVLKKHKLKLEDLPEFKAHIDKIKNYLRASFPTSQEKTAFLQSILFLSKNMKKNLLMKDCVFLNDQYLTLSETAINRIKDYVCVVFRDLSPDLQKKEFMKLYEERLELKLSQLARRVQPWCAKEVVENLPKIMEKIRSTDTKVQEEGLKEASELIRTVKIQAKKKLIVHIIALVALGITIAGFIAALVACPFSIPVFLLLLAGGIGTFNYFFSKGTLDCRGWHFSFLKTLPNWVQNLIKKLRTKPPIAGEEPASSTHPLNSRAASPLTGRVELVA